MAATCKCKICTYRPLTSTGGRPPSAKAGSTVFFRSRFGFEKLLELRLTGTLVLSCTVDEHLYHSATKNTQNLYEICTNFASSTAVCEGRFPSVLQAKIWLRKTFGASPDRHVGAAVHYKRTPVPQNYQKHTKFVRNLYEFRQRLTQNG